MWLYSHDFENLSFSFFYDVDTFGFILCEDVYAPEPHPPFPASIKDGYAVIGMFQLHTVKTL